MRNTTAHIDHLHKLNCWLLTLFENRVQTENRIYASRKDRFENFFFWFLSPWFFFGCGQDVCVCVLLNACRVLCHNVDVHTRTHTHTQLTSLIMTKQCEWPFRLSVQKRRSGCCLKEEAFVLFSENTNYFSQTARTSQPCSLNRCVCVCVRAFI